MKKVRIMLSAIAVLTVVGGALAFKAKDFTGKRLYCQNAARQCTISITGFTSVANANEVQNPCTTLGATGVSTTSFSTTSSTGPCANATEVLYTTQD